MLSRGISIRGLEGLPEIQPGDNLSGIILRALRENRDTELPPCRAITSGVAPGTVFVIAQKIVSKAEGRIVDLSRVAPSEKARTWSEKYHRDARMVEVILCEAKRVVRMDRGVLIVETHHGYICANAGVDASNAPKGTVILLPRDPDESARCLRQELEESLGVQVGVIISDTFGRPWRQGLSNVALGIAGLSPFIDYRGQLDSFGRPLQATVLAVADELAAAAELVMGKTLGVPVAVIEGFQRQASTGSGLDLIRPAEEDLFR